VKGEANQQDYGMRIYDPRVGKFLSVDPLTKSYPMLTPYQFASNTPIAAIDIDGEESGIPNSGFTYSGTPLSNYFDNSEGRKTAAKALGIGVVLGGAIAADIFVFKGAATKYTLYTIGVIGTMNFVSTVNNNGMQHDPKIRAENERKAKQQAAELIIGFGVGYGLSKGWQAGKLLAQEAGVFKAPLLDPMTAEMSTPLTEPLPSLSRSANFEAVVLKNGQKGGKQLNKAIKEIANGGGTPRFDEFGAHTVFEGRTASNGSAWAGALEYEVLVPDMPNQYRILKLQTGVDASGAATYKYGYSTDHYKTTIHEFKEVQPPTSNGTQ
jgi:RHS repeat-associated protein